MKSILSVSKELGLLTVALTLALVANFAYGQWAAPTVAPTGGSVDAPVNTGGVFQQKSGNLSAQTLGGTTVLAITQMQSPRYCDEMGANCFSAQDIADLISAGGNGTTPVAMIVNEVHTRDECEAAGGTVRLEGAEAICQFSGGSCPLGWSKYRNWSVVTSKTCSGSPYNTCGNSACTVGHGWSDRINTCSYVDDAYQGSDGCHGGNGKTCVGTRTSIGCY